MSMNLESSTETTELDQTAEISSSASVESFDEIPETEENFDDCGLEDSQEYTETPEKESSELEECEDFDDCEKLSEQSEEGESFSESDLEESYEDCDKNGSEINEEQSFSETEEDEKQEELKESVEEELGEEKELSDEEKQELDETVEEVQEEQEHSEENEIPEEEKEVSETEEDEKQEELKESVEEELGEEKELSDEEKQELDETVEEVQEEQEHSEENEISEEEKEVSETEEDEKQEELRESVEEKLGEEKELSDEEKQELDETVEEVQEEQKHSEENEIPEEKEVSETEENEKQEELKESVEEKLGEEKELSDEEKQELDETVEEVQEEQKHSEENEIPEEKEVSETEENEKQEELKESVKEKLGEDRYALRTADTIDETTSPREIQQAELENRTKLEAAKEEREQLKAALDDRFGQVVSMDRNSEGFKQALEEYNQMKDARGELDHRISEMEEQMKEFRLKTEEIRECQVEKGREAAGNMEETIAQAEQAHSDWENQYTGKMDSESLSKIREENDRVLDTMKQQEAALQTARDAKMAQINEYVMQRGLERADTRYDPVYQRMIDEYRQLSGAQDTLRYQKGRLEENNRQIEERLGPKDPENLTALTGERAYQKYRELETQGRIRHRRLEQPETHSVKASDIYGIDGYEQGDSRFWEHHGNNRDDYFRIAAQLPRVQEKIRSGASFEEICQDPQLRDCAIAYYREDKMVRVSRFGETYLMEDDGRHRIAAAKELGCEVPVKVVGTAEEIPERKEEIPGAKQAEQSKVIKERLASLFGFGKKGREPSAEVPKESPEVSKEPEKPELRNQILNQKLPYRLENPEKENLKKRIDKVREIPPEKLTDENRNEILEIAEKDLSACYSKYLKEKNLENPGKTLSFVSQKEMVELTGKENILGVYESKQDTVKLNKQLNRDMKHIMSTAQHEYLHWLSQKRNAEGKPDGLSGIKTLDDAYPAYNVAMNEGITEMLAVDQMKQYFPDYETRSYQLEVKAMQEFRKAYGEEKLLDAYMNNDLEALQKDYDAHMGEGSFVRLASDLHNIYLLEMNHKTDDAKAAYETLSQKLKTYQDAKRRNHE